MGGFGVWLTAAMTFAGPLLLVGPDCSPLVPIFWLHSQFLSILPFTLYWFPLFKIFPSAALFDF